jgi:predicted nucleic acid-binding protein
MFVDTSAWYAGIVPTDPQYHVVRRTLASGGRLVTTDYVLDETLTLLKARGHVDRARRFGTRILEGKAARLEFISERDIQQAWLVFTTFRDKAWSFTDCTSFIVMKRLTITQALALDEHFHQMPGISVVSLIA